MVLLLALLGGGAVGDIPAASAASADNADARAAAAFSVCSTAADCFEDAALRHASTAATASRANAAGDSLPAGDEAGIACWRLWPARCAVSMPKWLATLDAVAVASAVAPAAYSDWNAAAAST